MNSILEHIENQREMLIESKSEELFDAIQEGNVDEGVLGTILGGITGLTLGASIMRAVCKTLGIEKGPLYDVLTSKLVCTAAGAAIGNNFGK